MGLRDVVLLVAVAVGWLGPPPALGAPSAHDAARPAPATAALREQALQRLQEALGLPAPTFGGGGGGAGGERRAEAPEFMLELHRRVAHPDGVLRVPMSKGNVLPHDARIVRSFVEQEPAEEHLLRFNVSRLDSSEHVLGAELRVYRLRRTRGPLLLRVYQVEEGRGADGAGADEHRLLGVQATGARAPPGWHSFNVLSAVRTWLAGDAPNLGLLVTASALDGGHARAPAFARRGRHAPRRQPLLVLYDDEAPPAAAAAASGRTPTSGHHLYPSPSENDVDNAYEDDDYEGEDEERDYEDANGPDGQGEGEGTREEGPGGGRAAQRHGQRRGRRDAPTRRRRRRHGPGSLPEAAGTTVNVSNAIGNGNGNACARHNLYVEFDEIGWSSWILSPPGYNAYQCVGECPYPLGPEQSPTNHATVQSIVHALRLQPDAHPPCCTPEQLDGLSLLYTNEQGDVVLKLYEDMVASSCGCH